MSAKRSGAAAATCVVADDHPLFVEAVSDLLVAQGVEVVARASDGAAALAAIEAHRPTVAVLDIVMPLLGGIEVARLAHQCCPETAIILYTGFRERSLLIEAVDAGVRGFVRKDATLDELLRAFELVAAGGTYIDSVLAPTLVRGTAKLPGIALSPREREILRLLADGKGNDEIGRALHISTHTVRSYIRRAEQKLEVDNRTQAVAIALRKSYIT